MPYVKARQMHRSKVKTSETFTVTAQVSEYLSDSMRGDHPNYVYLALWPSDEIPTPGIALNFLRAQQSPLQLLPVQWGANLTVIVEASANPRIWIGRKKPTGVWESDLAQIIRVLGENGIEAELSLAPSRLPSRGTPNTDS